MTTAEILRKARDLYAANPSHVPSGTIPEGGSHCVISAMSAAGDDDYKAEDALLEVLAPDDPRGFGIISWNACSTTAEVVAAFNRAIEMAEALS